MSSLSRPSSAAKQHQEPIQAGGASSQQQQQIGAQSPTMPLSLGTIIGLLAQPPSDRPHDLLQRLRARLENVALFRTLQLATAQLEDLCRVMAHRTVAPSEEIFSQGSEAT
jgi:hypothetical protein